MSELLTMQGIVKCYPNGVVANDQVDFALRQGEIHALVGENGAGKSTLVKLLYGLEQPDRGEIRLHGRRVVIPDPPAAIRLGIGMVHQHFMLVPSFTVAQNVVLGNEPRRRGLVDARAAAATTARLAAEFGLAVDPDAPVETAPVGMRQRTEILKALYRGASLLILDEPTAVLTPQETDDLFAALQRLVARGRTVIFITHKLAEVVKVAGRVTVMRRGQVVGAFATAATSEEALARLMMGGDRPPPRPAAAVQRGEAVVEVRNLGYVTEDGRPALRNVDLTLYAGEILGVAGVEGNGQRELAEVLGGLRRATTGEVRIKGEVVAATGVRAMRRAGVAHIPEDRLANGVALPASLAENLVVDRYWRPPFARWGVSSRRTVRGHAVRLMAAFDIRAAGPDAPLASLSGGNLQKVVVARELASPPLLLIAAQPTRGVDVGAAEAVHARLDQLRRQGSAVLLISADLEEVLALADRVAVLYEGRLVARFAHTRDLDAHRLGLYMLGVQVQPAEALAAGA